VSFITIDGFPIDAAISEDHTFDSDVTDHPVETGSEITDNIQPKPIQVTLDCLVSDTPIGPIAEARGDIDTNGQLILRPSSDAYALMIGIRDKREPVTIATSLQVFENMALVSLSVPRNAQNGESLRFKAVFKQIKYITNLRTTVPVAVPRCMTKEQIGNKSAKENKDVKAKKRTAAKHIVDALDVNGAVKSFGSFVNRGGD
jgi:hypothetical protein